MNKLEHLISEVEQFESNMKSIATVLDALRNVSKDYEQTVVAPQKLTEKLVNFNNDYNDRLEHLNEMLEALVLDFHQYDKLVSDSIVSASDHAAEALSESFSYVVAKSEARLTQSIDDVKKASDFAAASIESSCHVYDNRCQDILNRLNGLVEEMSQANRDKHEAIVLLQQTVNQRFDALNHKVSWNIATSLGAAALVILFFIFSGLWR